MFDVKNKLLLLVEDEAIIALSESMQLKKMGYRVITTNTGEEAIELCKTNSDIDLILMDIDLGNDMLDGTQAAAAILEQKDIPIVFLSGHTEPEVVEKTEKITSYGYVVKNSGITVLDASIKMAFKLFDAKKNEEKKENALRESEANFKGQARILDLIFENSLDSIVLLDKDYNFIRVSKTYAEACKRDIGEFAGKNHFDLYPSPLKDEFDQAKREKRIYHKNARPFVFPDHPEWGTTYWNLGLVPIFDENNEIEMFLFTLKDVTDYIRATK